MARSAATRTSLVLDRLVIAHLIEARSLERFRLLADHLEDQELRALYAELLSSEASHRAFFLDAARKNFSEAEVTSELERFAAVEAEVIRALPFDHLVHSGPPERA